MSNPNPEYEPIPPRLHSIVRASDGLLALTEDHELVRLVLAGNSYSVVPLKYTKDLAEKLLLQSSEYERQHEINREFFDRLGVVTEEPSVPFQTLYSHYQNFAAERGINAASPHSLGLYLKRIFPNYKSEPRNSVRYTNIGIVR